jgi:D-amino-acid dehydrogenase
LSNINAAVVGGGIIGLSIAYHLVQSGASVIVIDRDPDGDKASLGNAGAIAVTEVVPAAVPGIAWRVPGWLLDPLGPLTIRPAHFLKLIPWLVRFARAGISTEAERISEALAAINSRVYVDLLPMLADADLGNQLRRTGALTVYETEQGFRRDSSEWARKRALNIEVSVMSGDEARQLEPSLGPGIQRAVFTPQWSHVSDPKTILEGLRHWLRSRGSLICGGEVINLVSSSSSVTLELEGGTRVEADRAVIAAGAWSAILAGRLGDRVSLESERGYNTTLPEPGVEVRRQLIFAERKFVATPLSCGLRIGGAAEFGGLTAAPNFKRSQRLVELASRHLPGLRTEGATCWSGHRPATPDSLPVISPARNHPSIYYAFGHGHLGLTQAATTGRLVCEWMQGKTPSIDMTPYRVARFN